MSRKLLIQSRFLSWSVSEAGQLLGILRAPFFLQALLGYGNAVFKTGGKTFELTYPKRAAHLLGEKEASLRLLRDGAVLLEIVRELHDGVTKFHFQWGGKDHSFVPDAGVWRVFTGSNLEVEILEHGGWSTQKEITVARGDWPTEILVALFWATVCPLALV